MIIVRVELHSAVTGKVTELARATIANVGGTNESGDYDVRTLRGRDTATLDRGGVQRQGHVRGHPRLREHVWNLVAKALVGLGYGKGPATAATAPALPALTPAAKSPQERPHG